MMMIAAIMSSRTGLLLRITACTAAALFFAGCGISPNEQEGHKEPELGKYSVGLSKTRIVLELDANSPAVSEEIAIRVDCVNNAPTAIDCSSHQPMWIARKPANTPFLSVTIDDPSKAQTTARITVDKAQYLARYGTDLSSLGEHWFMVGFIPTSIPDKLKLSGVRDVVVLVRRLETPEPQPPAREEQAPEKPELWIAPRTMFLYNDRVSQATVSGTATLFYKGPDTEIASVELSGPGANKFEILSPAAGFAFKPEQGINGTLVKIQFNTPIDDLTRHMALLTITTANGLRTSLLLTAQRQGF